MMFSIFILALAGWGAAGEPAAKHTEADFRRAAAKFLEQPLSEEGRTAVLTILEFAEESDKVTVVIGPWFVPWMRLGEDKKPEHLNLLLAAYTAGNVLSQLDSGVNANDTYSATIQVFRVYRYLKSRDSSYAVPEVETLLEIHRKGGLATHFDKAEKEGKENQDKEKAKTGAKS
jgi:hypothetical protein